MTSVARAAVTGAAGQLGVELVRAFSAAGVVVDELNRPEFDLASPDVANVLASLRPQVVVNAAAWTDVDACARDPERAMELNGSAVGRLAAAAERAGARFIQVSSNEVFDGAQQRAYAEGDEPHPINAYGASKLAGEQAARAAAPSATIVRTAWIYGGPRSFPAKIRAAAELAAAEGRTLRVVADEVGNPTPAARLARRIVAVALSDAPRPTIIHLAGEPPASRHKWATYILAAAGLPRPEPMSLRDYERASSPPPHAVLDTSLSRSLGLALAWQDLPA